MTRTQTNHYSLDYYLKKLLVQTLVVFFFGKVMALRDPVTIFLRSHTLRFSQEEHL